MAMQFYNRTIKGFFDNSRSYVIPVYQRAYSWETPEWKTFLDDLKEQIQGTNNYFFGNFLLETINEDDSYEIIDGQQRLTTLTIFMRSIITVLTDRIKHGEQIPIKLEEKEKLYIKNGGIIKLRPVNYDQVCYDTLIVDNKDSFEAQSPSQKRINQARVYFTKECAKLETVKLIRIIEKIEATKVTSIELEGKKDSALIFELENNRGKDLTNLERLKSYFMYQMYVYSDVKEISNNINHLSNTFKSLYLIINDIALTEDSILIYHCNAYINGFNYRNIDDIKEAFKKSSSQVQWIKDFTGELHTSFSNVKKLEKSEDKYLACLRKLNMPVFNYPFIIKGYKYFGDDAHKLSKLFQVLEIVTFRYKLINSRAEINSRLNDVLSAFKGDIPNLISSFKLKLNSERYWTDERVKEFLNGAMYGNNVDNYLLWEYEDSIQNEGYKVGDCEIIEEQIEHISPQNPKQGEPELAKGYEVNGKNQYDEEFLEEYLNSLGNLMLISPTHNQVIGNKAFKLKLDSYNLNPLLNQQAEIRALISGTMDEPTWDKDAIDRRHEKVLNFALSRWSFDSIN